MEDDIQLLAFDVPHLMADLFVHNEKIEVWIAEWLVPMDLVDCAKPIWVTLVVVGVEQGCPGIMAGMNVF